MAKLYNDLRAAHGDREKQDRLILDTYGQLKEADQHLLEEAFGEQNFRRFNSKDIDENAKKLHQFTDEQIEDLKKQEEAFADTAAAAKKFATEIELSFSKPMKEASEAVGEFIREHGKDMKDFLAEVAADLKSADWADFAKGIGKAATEAKKFVDTFGGIETLEGLAALKYGGVPGLAAFAAFKALQPSPLNKNEDELERQKKLGINQPPTIDLHGAAPSVLDKNPTGGGFHFFKENKPPSIWEYETPPAEKMSLRGRIPDIPKPGMDGLQRAAYRTGEETPGAEIRAEGTVYRATMRGTAEGSRIGVLNAFHELEDEKRRGAGIQTAAYHPGGAAGEGGLGGGYGGLGGGPGGGGAGGGLGGGAGVAPGKVTQAEHAARGAILGGKVREHAKAMREAANVPAGRIGAKDAYNLIKQAGGTDEEAYTMAGIALAESSGNRRSANLKGEHSLGLWQINLRAHSLRKFGLTDEQQLFDPLTNARAALQLKRARGNYLDWSAYKSGAYRKYLPKPGDVAHSGTPQPHDYARIMPHDRHTPGDRLGGYENFREALGLARGSPAHLPPLESRKQASETMTPAEINAWNEAHKYGTGPGQIAPPHGASLHDHLAASRAARAAHGHHGLIEGAYGGQPYTRAEPGGPESAAGYRAEGGDVFAQHPYIVGEKGPELFIPGRKGHILAHDKAVNFGQIALDTMHQLQKDFGLKRHQALGAVANLGYESHAFQWMKQRLKGGNEWLSQKAGRGWAQWSGKRHQQFIDYAFQQGLGPDSPEANYGFLKHELGGEFRHVIQRLRHARSLVAATRIFEQDYEGAGKPHLGARLTFAKHLDLLDNARKAGMIGAQPQKVTGEASMRIDLRGFPKGTKTKTEMSGMFSKIRVARGRAMPLANMES